MISQPTFFVKRMHRLASIPTKATPGSVGFDLIACIDAPITVWPDQTVLVGTGISLAPTEAGLATVLVPRSGLGHKHGIVLGNLTGIIDTDYRGEIKVSIWNRSETSFTLHPGDRMAQMLVIQTLSPVFIDVPELPESERGDGGFGSSGVSS